MNTKTATLTALLALGLTVGSQCFFIVDQTEQAIVLQLGQPIGKPREAGIHFKMPFIQDVRSFDKRVLAIDPPADQVVISSGQTLRNKPSTAPKVDTTSMDSNKGGNTPVADDGPRLDNISGEPIIVDTFARYKITDPLQFMKTLKTVQNANSRLESILNDSTRAVLGKTTLPELLSEKRNTVMDDIRKRVNEKIAEDSLGIEIIDVRIVRADLTDELRSSTVKQMNSALHERATERRAEGEQKSLEIRSSAEKERTVILAEAQRDAQIKRGEGDKEAIKIYTDAFNVDPEFYGFLRSLEAYKTTMSNPETRLILSPDSKFFKYFDKGSPAPQ